MRTLTLVALVVFLAVLAPTAAAVPVPAYHSNSGCSGYYTHFVNHTVGYVFQPAQDIWVTHLGVLDFYGNGLVNPHAVGMFDADTQALLGADVVTRPLIVGQNTYADWYPYRALQYAIPLTAGRRYVIGGTATGSDHNTYAGYMHGYQLHADISIVQARVSAATGADLHYPDQVDGNWGLMSSFYGPKGGAILGPNFKFEYAPPRPYAAWTDARYGVFTSMDDGQVLGEGVVQTDLGAEHKLSAQALGDQLTDGPKTNEMRRRFVFQRGDGGTGPTEVYLIGLLDGFLHATDGAYAKVDPHLALYDADGNLITHTTKLYEVRAPYGIDNVDEQYFTNTPIYISATIQPGVEYEFVSRMTVEARKGGVQSTGRAIFDNTFTVQISGEPVPEPATAALLALGALATIKRRRA